MLVDQIVPVLKSCGHRYEGEITSGTYLTDLGIDSVGILELVVSLEEQFNISFEDEDLVSANFQTIGSLLNLLEKYVS